MLVSSPGFIQRKTPSGAFYLMIVGIKMYLGECHVYLILSDQTRVRDIKIIMKKTFKVR